MIVRGTVHALSGLYKLLKYLIKFYQLYYTLKSSQIGEGKITPSQKGVKLRNLQRYKTFQSVSSKRDGRSQLAVPVFWETPPKNVQTLNETTPSTNIAAMLV